jgi:hypothetical protein
LSKTYREVSLILKSYREVSLIVKNLQRSVTYFEKLQRGVTQCQKVTEKCHLILKSYTEVSLPVKVIEKCHFSVILEKKKGDAPEYLSSSGSGKTFARGDKITNYKIHSTASTFRTE